MFAQEYIQFRVTELCHSALKFALLGLVLLGGVTAYAALPIESWTTPTGARVMFMRADAIPMLDIQLDFDAGSRRDTVGLTGLAAMTAALLGKGIVGPEPKNEAQIADAFADIGAEFGSAAGTDHASATIRTLSSQPELGKALALFADALHHPTFPQEVLDREKARAISVIRESATKPESIASKTFSKLMYGTHPYGFEMDEQTVTRIDRDALLKFYQQYYGAAHAVVSLVGNVSRSQAEEIATRLTQNLPQSTGALPSIAAVTLPAGVESRIAHPSSQSHVLIGVPALQRGDADFFPIVVGNYILGGGGFASRLMAEVREKRGLAYSAYSNFSAMSQLGPFQMGLQTKKEQTDLALKVARDTLADFLRQGPSEQELIAAKQNLVGGFPLRIDSNKKLLAQIAAIGFYRLPNDYLDHWSESIERVSVAQIRDAFQRRIKPENLVTVVVGQGEVVK